MNQPLTVLIVDDEMPIRQELKTFPWEQHHAVWLGEARNGEEALAFCRSYPPDVVITDISMPVMDGLALVRELRKQHPAVKAILLTCHSDFHYAQEAIQLGALDYIVKITMTDDQLRHALEKAREAIQRDQSYRGQLQYRHKYEQGRAFRLWLEASGEERKRCRQQLRDSGLDWAYPVELAVLHTIGHEQEVLFADLEMMSYLETAVRSDGGLEGVLPLNAGRCLLIRSRNAEDGGAVAADWAERLAADAGRAVLARLPFIRDRLRFCIAVSEGINDEKELADSVKQLEQAREQSFYEPERPVLVLQRGWPQAGPEDLVELDNLMRRAMKDADSLRSFVADALPQWAVRCRPDSGDLKRRVLTWRRLWYPEKEERGAPAADRRLMEADSLPALIDELLAEMSAEPVQKSRYEISRAKQLIAQRLDEDMTLTQIAEEIGLRDHYFSRLFRQETGETFGDYVMRSRMDKAVQLLKTTNLKVYEIAEQVGIPNYRYFCVLFRKWTGATPRDYRKG